MKFVNVGISHCMIVEDNGSLWCFGGNQKGCLATGDSKSRKKPF